MLITRSLYKAYLWFRLGYAVPASASLSLAKAERMAQDAGCTYEWVDDGDGWPKGGVCTCGCGRKIETCEGCILRDENGCILASLWGIWDADDDYRRIVQAELVMDAILLIGGGI